MTDCIGVDQSYPFTAAGLATATGLIGAPPPFWGRYFKTKAKKGGTQYDGAVENAGFKAAGLRLLPLGRQTAHVKSDKPAVGKADGADNAAAIVDALGAEVLKANANGNVVFLDIEPEVPLNHIYYENWSAALVAGGAAVGVKFIPCVYGHHNAADSWKALGVAIGNGATCGAAWIVYETDNEFPIGPWKATKFVGKSMPASVPVVLVQRILDMKIVAKLKGKSIDKGTYDFDLVNPDHQDWLLARMVVPQ